ncbi:MAG: putative toxin-antitoxin system toxin component, PIN family [candidate division NC10 bacterium]|nr:putative toxin-antitoxin system toxin component, PIN family [candidate division NC10 bacterium]
MIIVLDTNVVVSGLLRPHSKPATILRLVATGVLRVAYDERILAEYREVLRRPKFPFSSEQIRAFLDQTEAEGVPVVALPLRSPLPDPDDAPFLEVAVAAHADALVTGNPRHYPARVRHGIPVMDPASFLDRWTRQQQR